MTQEEQEKSGFGEPFIRDGENFICPKCGSKNYMIWPGMFVDRFTCKDCGYSTHM